MTTVAPTEPEQEIITRERLRLLAIGFYVKGAVGAVFVSFLLLHFFAFLGFSFIPESSWQPKAPTANVETLSVSPSPTPRPVNQGPPVIMFRIFAAVIGCIILAGWTFGALTIYAGRCVRNRERRMFIYVMAGLNCALIPWGTLLGVSTFIVLQTPVARREFGLSPR
jgi:fermentation-respiration switch protein FrsA (DUF1100 family)